MKRDRLLLLSLIFLIGCGKKSASVSDKGDYKELPTIPAPENPGPQNPSLDRGRSVDDVLPVIGEKPIQGDLSACDYWNSLPDGKGNNVFRLVQDVSLQTVKEGKTQVQKVYGKHLLSELPQVQYVLSQEYADSLLAGSPSHSSVKAQATCPAIVTPSGKTPLDPPNIEEFMALAKQKKDCGELSAIEYGALQFLYYAAKYDKNSKKLLLETRNTAVMDEAEKQLPGAFRGNTGPLEKSEVLKRFLLANNFLAVTPDLMPALRIFEKRVVLRVPESLVGQQFDLEQSLQILSSEKSRTDDSLEEKACRFALSQRMTAQMLSVKGVRGVPLLKDSGLLADIPVEDVTLFPKTDRLGDFQNVITEPWVQEQLLHPTTSLPGVHDTESLLQAIRLYMKWTRYRDEKLWTARGEIDAPAGELKMPGDLLYLGFGLFGIAAHKLSNEELIITPERRIHLRDDSTHNLALLGVLTLEIGDTYSSLLTPTPFEQSLLSAEELHEFTAPYPVGVLAQFDLLTSGLIFEGLYRLQHGDDSEELKAVLRAIGRKIGNARLINLE